MSRGPLPPTHPAVLKAMQDSTELAEGIGQLALDIYEFCSPWVVYDEATGDFEVRYWMGDAHVAPEADIVSANGGSHG